MAVPIRKKCPKPWLPIHQRQEAVAAGFAIAMKKGDLVLYYHSGAEPEVVAIAKVVKESYRDPTTDDERWVAVDIAPVKPLKSPVPLDEIKKEKRLKDISLIKQGRLSVMPVTKDEYEVILGLGSGKK